MNEYFTADPALASRYPKAKAVLVGEADSLITFVEDRAGHDWRYAIDATKTNNELGYKPVESFETGIRKTVEWYLNREDWWKGLL